MKTKTSVKVGFSNGDVVQTEINLTPKAAAEYYAIGKQFNIGSVSDNLQTVSSFEFKPAKIHSLEIHAKEWFDKINGVSYFAARIIVNGDTEYRVPFQNGYGNQYIYESMYLLRDNGFDIGEERDFFNEWFIFKGTPAIRKAIVSFQENCTKADVKRYGQGGL
jgi:hypothetical protein